MRSLVSLNIRSITAADCIAINALVIRQVDSSTTNFTKKGYVVGKLEDIYQQELLARLFHSLTRIQKDPSFHLTMGHLSL